MKKLLIAANSGILLKAVSNSLSGQFEVLTCRTGMEAVQQMQQFCPDVIAVDLMLTGIDGVGVLKLARTMGIHARTLAFSTYISEYSVNALEQLNVDRLMQMPVELQAFAAILQELAEDAQEETAETRVRSMLTLLGFAADSGGYITRLCVLQYLSDPRQQLVKTLYPAVAQALGTTDKQVERAMGRAIDAVWQHCDERIWSRYFPVDGKGRVERPSNKQFLSAMGKALLPWMEISIGKATG